MAPATGFDGGKDPPLPVTPSARIMGLFRQFRDTHIVSPGRIISPTSSSISDQPALASHEPQPLIDDVGSTLLAPPPPAPIESSIIPPAPIESSVVPTPSAPPVVETVTESLVASAPPVVIEPVIVIESLIASAPTVQIEPPIKLPLIEPPVTIKSSIINTPTRQRVDPEEESTSYSLRTTPSRRSDSPPPSFSPSPSSSIDPDGSVSHSIQRRVEIAELELDTCMANLDIVSQVSDPTPFDPIPFSPLPTDWRGGLTPDYIIKLNDLPYKLHIHTCDMIDHL